MFDYIYSEKKNIINNPEKFILFVKKLLPKYANSLPDSAAITIFREIKKLKRGLKMVFQNRKKFCYFKENGINEINYKDIKLLRRFVNDQGKIMPRRVTGTSAKMHRKLVRAIKRSRSIALMPYVEKGTD